jgi:hypothetical protein
VSTGGSAFDLGSAGVQNSSDWSQIGTIHKGDSQFIFDAGSEIALQPWSATVGLQQFTATISAWPLNGTGEVQPVHQAPTINHTVNIPFASGLNSGVGIKVNANEQLGWNATHFGNNGFRWSVSYRPQQDIHQNSSGYRIYIFGKKP